MNNTVKITASLAGAAAALLAVGCSSSNSSSSSSHSASTPASTRASASSSSGTPAARSGTEVFSGVEQLTKAQLASNTYNPVIPLHASGVFTDTGSITLVPGSGSNGDGPGPGTFKLSRGNLALTHTADSRPNAQPVQVRGCEYHVIEHVSYTLTVGTGTYARASGHGTATVTYDVTQPVPAAGICGGAASSANPVSGSVTFLASGPVTLP